MHGAGASPMDVDALVKAKGGNRGVKGKDNGSKSAKFDGNCYWCGVYGRALKDCWASAPVATRTQSETKGQRQRR